MGHGDPLGASGSARAALIVAGADRPANSVLLAIAAVAAGALILYPVVGGIVWQASEKRSPDVLVYNATVVTEERSQQRAVDLVLEHLKVEDVNFVGAEPGGVDVGSWPDAAPDVVFLVDAYGVYLDDVVEAGTGSPTLLTRPLGDPIAPDLEAWRQAGTFIYAEFNVLHSPTPADVSERFQELLGVDALGWTGRWYEDLSEVGPRLRALTDDPWPESGPGLILVGGSVGDKAVPAQILLVTGPDLADHPPTIVGSTPDGREVAPSPMLEWFSVMAVADPATVHMWLDLPIEGEAAEALANLGIDSQIPLLVLGDKTAYFAANMSRTAATFPTRGIAGALDVMRSLPQSKPVASFYRATAPTLRWIVENN